jgi:hypothetical protein
MCCVRQALLHHVVHHRGPFRQVEPQQSTSVTEPAGCTAVVEMQDVQISVQVSVQISE